jgi:HEXXH motif-containing protein
MGSCELSWVAPFSLAGELADDELLNAIVGSHGTGITAWLVREHEDRISTASPDLHSYLREWSISSSTFDVCWHRSFGAAGLMVQRVPVDPLAIAIGIGLRLAETGCLGTWDVHVPGLTLLVGSTLLRGVEHLSIDESPTGTYVSVRLSTGRRIELASTTDRPEAGADVESLRALNGSASICLLPDADVFRVGGKEYAFREVPVLGSINDETAASFDEGCNLLRDVAPTYGQWVERALRGILISREEDSSKRINGSAEIAPGIIHASSGMRPVDVVEVLVHEASHQYFYMLERAGPMDDGSDSTRYWSPPVGGDRPLSRILIAYHAFANIRLLYECIRESPVARADLLGYVEANIEYVDEMVAGLDEPLMLSDALTPLGYGVYAPLAGRVAALSQPA